ncbi:MAG: C40 family peptidase [Clostridia bacterium]|nr:C40 family peptidase [Clostridia bacterium]
MKKAYLLIMLAFLQIPLSGCGGGSAKTSAETGKDPGSVQSDSGETAAKPHEKKQDMNKNIGVIIDTVADVFKEPSVQSERVTQAIFNQSVTILNIKEDWIQVKVLDGYTGWVKSKFIEKDLSGVNEEGYEYRLVVTTKTKSVYSMPKGGVILKQVVMGTEFSVMDKRDNWYQVALPGKTSGWVNESGTIQVAAKEHIPKTTAADFVATASKLKGSVYLWGGISSMGIDYSGLTYICSRINGVDLPRDADMQYTVGEEIEKNTDLMKPGDLVFFSAKEDLKGISHVGIYTGNSQFIHATKSKGAVAIGTLGDEYYRQRFVGVRRIFKE